MENNEKYTLEDVKRIAWMAVQYNYKLERDGIVVLKKEYVDHFVDVETETTPLEDFKPPVEGFNWFKRKKNG